MATNEYSLKEEAAVMQKIGAEFEKLPEESKIRVVNWLNSVVKKGESSIQEEAQGIEKTDIKKFWQAKSPKNNYEKIAVLGYHFELIQKGGNFTLKDIESLWEQTGDVLPGHQVIRNAWRDGRAKYHYVTSCRGTKKCRIATRGQELVEALPDAPAELGGTVKSKRKRGR